MKTAERYTGICTYCTGAIAADATPRDADKGFTGPLNVPWNHVDGNGDVRDADHDAVPRGPWVPVPNSARFRVEPYGDVDTLCVPAGALERGHQFIGPDDDTVYEVTAPVCEHPQGWLFVRRVVLIGTRCTTCGRRGYRSAECNECGGQNEPGHGFFNNMADTDAVHLITNP